MQPPGRLPNTWDRVLLATVLAAGWALLLFALVHLAMSAL